MRLSYDQRTRAYMAKSTADGKTKAEAPCCLKRYTGREVCNAPPQQTLSLT